jgi:hypothetical protein
MLITAMKRSIRLPSLRRSARRVFLAGLGFASIVPVLARGDGAPVATTAASPTTHPDVAAGEPRTKPTNPSRAAKSAAVEEVNFTVEQWMAFESFMARESPNKWSTFQQMQQRAPDRPNTRKLKNTLAVRYHELKTISAIDPRRYDFELAAIHLEDDVYRVLQDLRAKRGQPEQLESKLRELGRAFVDNRHAWREERIKRVREELNQLGMKKAVAALHEELSREEATKKKSREEQSEQMVKKWKESANQPRLRSTLPGVERPPADSNSPGLP